MRHRSMKDSDLFGPLQVVFKAGAQGVYGVVGVGLVTFESPKAKAATMVLSGLPWAFS